VSAWIRDHGAGVGPATKESEATRFQWEPNRLWGDQWFRTYDFSVEQIHTEAPESGPHKTAPEFAEIAG
jgi:hypothetical protein